MIMTKYYTDVMNVKRSEGWEFRAEPFHFIFTCFLRCGVKFISLSFCTSVLHLSNFVSAVIFPTLLLSLEWVQVMHSSHLKESLNADLSVFYNVRKIQFIASQYSVSFNASVYDKRCTETANITTTSSICCCWVRKNISLCCHMQLITTRFWNVDVHKYFRILEL